MISSLQLFHWYLINATVTWTSMLVHGIQAYLTVKSGTVGIIQLQFTSDFNYSEYNTFISAEFIYILSITI